MTETVFTIAKILTIIAMVLTGVYLLITTKSERESAKKEILDSFIASHKAASVGISTTMIITVVIVVLLITR